MGTYNGMWPRVEHQCMLGGGVNLPVQRARREAAVDQAQANLARSNADTAQLRDRIGFEVDEALRHAREADAIVATYRDRLLPVARELVTAKRDGLDTGRTNFVEVIRSERDLKRLELRYYAAIADAYRRRAQLDRAVGRMPGGAADGGVQ